MRALRPVLASVLLALAMVAPAGAVTLSDPKITESSWLALDAADQTVAYTGNDENGPLFSVDVNTGKKLGETKLTGVTLVDPESADVSANTALWLADIGDNAAARKVLALYVLGAPGRGNHSVTPERYRFQYSDGKAHNAESFMFNPVTGNRYIITKESSGLLFRNDVGTLDQSTVGTFRMVGSKLPAYVTEAKFTPDGRFVLCRQKDQPKTITVLDGSTFVTLARFAVPSVKQPESLDTDGTSVWVGSEGKSSPLLKVALPAAYR